MRQNAKEKAIKKRKEKATLLAYPQVPLYVVNSTVEKENQWSVDLFPNNRSLEMIFY